MLIMEGLSDEALIGEWRADATPAANAFVDALFERHYQKVSLWCLRFAGDRETAAEWAQEVFLAAYRNLHSFRGDSKFSTWLYTIARNYCLSCVKARASAPPPASLLDDIPDAEATDSLSRLEKEGSASTLRRLMREALSETEFRVVSLHYIEELPLDTITRLLGLSNASGAKAYIVSARRKLQQAAVQADVCNRRSGGAAYGPA